MLRLPFIFIRLPCQPLCLFIASVFTFQHFIQSDVMEDGQVAGYFTPDRTEEDPEDLEYHSVLSDDSEDESSDDSNDSGTTDAAAETGAADAGAEVGAADTGAADQGGTR